MIQSFTIENFKSYRKAELKLAPLTVLVGANASGKSNALEAIRFLSWMAQGQKLSSLQFEVNQKNAAIRGQLKDVFFRGEKSFRLGCKVNSASKDLGGWKLLLKLDLRAEKEIHVYEESVYSEKDEML